MLIVVVLIAVVIIAAGVIFAIDVSADAGGYITEVGRRRRQARVRCAALG